MTKAGMIAGLLLAVAGCSSAGSSPNVATGSAGTHGQSGSAGAAGISGSGGVGGASSCAAATVVGASNAGTVSWRDNGTIECAFLIIADRTTTTAADTLEIDATTADSHGIDIVLSSYSGLLAGTYTCQPGNGTTQPYAAFEIVGQKGSGNAAMSACTITIAFTTDSAGQQHAQGTFSGTLAADAGTDIVTEGTFDVAVSAP